MSSELIEGAKRLDKRINHTYLVKDITKDLKIYGSFDKGMIILALQNVKKPFGVIRNFSKLKKAGLARIAFDSMQVAVSNLSKKAIKKADLVILPDVENINVLDFVKAKEYVEIGYRTMKKNMDQLNKLFR